MNDAISERDVVIPAKAPPALRQVRSVTSAARGQGPSVRRLPPVQSQGQALDPTFAGVTGNVSN
jgi:hypothetical protein